MKTTSKHDASRIAEHNAEQASPRAYASITGMEDDLYRASWVEPTGDLIIRYNQRDVRRMHRMACQVRELLQIHNDAELKDIENDITFCISTLQHVIEMVYEKREVKSNA